MDISVVIPLYNEAESLPELHAWIKRVMDANRFSYEIIFVNDGSTDRSWDIIEELSKSNPEVKGIKFRRNYGKFRAGNRNAMTRSRKPYPPSFSMQRHGRCRAYTTYTISTAG